MLVTSANEAARRSPTGSLKGSWTGFDRTGVQWAGYVEDDKITTMYPLQKRSFRDVRLHS